jgi:hypothetical protein
MPHRPDLTLGFNLQPWRPKPEENPDLNRSPGDRRGAKRPGGSKGREV